MFKNEFEDERYKRGFMQMKAAFIFNLIQQYSGPWHEGKHIAFSFQKQDHEKEQYMNATRKLKL